MAQTTIQGAFLDSTLDITSLVLSGASPLVFEGATADAHETTLAFVDPTADRTITFPNTTGTLALTSDLTSYITISSTDTFTNKTFDADGTGNSLTNVENANVKAAAAIALNKLAATTVSRALVSDGSGFVSASAVTATEIGHLDGVTGAIQTQLGTKAPIAGATLTGTTQFATLSDGTIAVTAWVDEDNMASNSATLIPTQQSVKAYVDAGGGDLSFGGDTFGEDKIIGSNDAYALSFETAGTVRMRIEGAEGGAGYTAAGAITMPWQPAVFAYNSATDPDVTGNGASPTVDFNTELFDHGGDFANDTFQAPVTGRYRVDVAIDVGGLVTSSFNFYAELVTSNRIIEFSRANVTYANTNGAGQLLFDRWKFTGSVMCDMDAGDTVYARPDVDSNENSNNADILGLSYPVTFISVNLVV